jgi:predicted alpha/beta hydrolase
MKQAACRCGSMAAMTHWLIIRLMKDAVLMAAIVAAIVIIYRKLSGRG